MDKINHDFQELLKSKNFVMKIIDDIERIVYQGRLELASRRIDFAASLTKSDVLSIGQIVYNNIAYCTDSKERDKWLAFINKVNLQHGLYYYMGMEEDGRIFLRHTCLVSKDIIPFFNILISGSEIAGQILQLIHEEFHHSTR